MRGHQRSQTRRYPDSLLQLSWTLLVLFRALSELLPLFRYYLHRSCEFYLLDSFDAGYHNNRFSSAERSREGRMVTAATLRVGKNPRPIQSSETERVRSKAKITATIEHRSSSTICVQAIE